MKMKAKLRQNGRNFYIRVPFTMQVIWLCANCQTDWRLQVVYVNNSEPLYLCGECRNSLIGTKGNGEVKMAIEFAEHGRKTITTTTPNTSHT